MVMCVLYIGCWLTRLQLIWVQPRKQKTSRGAYIYRLYRRRMKSCAARPAAFDFTLLICILLVMIITP